MDGGHENVNLAIQADEPDPCTIGTTSFYLKFMNHHEYNKQTKYNHNYQSGLEEP